MFFLPPFSKIYKIKIINYSNKTLCIDRFLHMGSSLPYYWTGNSSFDLFAVAHCLYEYHISSNVLVRCFHLEGHIVF